MVELGVLRIFLFILIEDVNGELMSLKLVKIKSFICILYISFIL